MKTSTAPFLIAVTLLGNLGSASHQQIRLENAPIDASNSAERDQLDAPAVSLPNKRNQACISWHNPIASDIDTRLG